MKSLITVLSVFVFFFFDNVYRLTINVAGKRFYAAASDSVVKQKRLIITDQSENRILIADVETKQIVWQWKAADGYIKGQDTSWFGAPSDAKPVFKAKYILMLASKGGVALIRINDKKVM